jgi:hypothetical protein
MHSFLDFEELPFLSAAVVRASSFGSLDAGEMASHPRCSNWARQPLMSCCGCQTSCRDPRTEYWRSQAQGSCVGHKGSSSPPPVPRLTHKSAPRDQISRPDVTTTAERAVESPPEFTLWQLWIQPREGGSLEALCERGEGLDSKPSLKPPKPPKLPPPSNRRQSKLVWATGPGACRHPKCVANSLCEVALILMCMYVMN